MTLAAGGPRGPGDGHAAGPADPAPAAEGARTAQDARTAQEAQAAGEARTEGDVQTEPARPAEVDRLSAAVQALDALGELPVSEHVARYQAVHGELSDALSSIDEV
jgi:hypothetical protein